MANDYAEDRDLVRKGFDYADRFCVWSADRKDCHWTTPEAELIFALANALDEALVEIACLSR